MLFLGQDPTRNKIVINFKCIEHVPNWAVIFLVNAKSQNYRNWFFLMIYFIRKFDHRLFCVAVCVEVVCSCSIVRFSSTFIRIVHDFMVTISWFKSPSITEWSRRIYPHYIVTLYLNFTSFNKCNGFLADFVAREMRWRKSKVPIRKTLKSVLLYNNTFFILYFHLFASISF